MDLRHARTFVTVAELGTVTKAALQLRVAQPALSRHINDLEGELGFKLFDRIGRRLVLTSEGEQLLGDCRNLLTYAGAVGERAQLLRRGDTGVLKVAASPQHVESVFSQLLPRYAQHYPNVEVKIREGSGREILDMLERGEIHLAQNLLHGVQPDPERFAMRPLGSVDLLVACDLQLALGRKSTIEVSQLVAHPLLVLDTGVWSSPRLRCGLSPCQSIAQYSFRKSVSTHAACAGRGGARRRHYSHRVANPSYDLRIFGLTYRGKPLSEPLFIVWDKRRVMPRYATSFCAMWLGHVRKVFPITRPTAIDQRRDGKP